MRLIVYMYFFRSNRIKRIYDEIWKTRNHTVIYKYKKKIIELRHMIEYNKTKNSIWSLHSHIFDGMKIKKKNNY